MSQVHCTASEHEVIRDMPTHGPCVPAPQHTTHRRAPSYHPQETLLCNWRSANYKSPFYYPKNTPAINPNTNTQALLHNCALPHAIPTLQRVTMYFSSRNHTLHSSLHPTRNNSAVIQAVLHACTSSLTPSPRTEQIEKSMPLL